MANCGEMKVGDVFVCELCGLELSVKNPCTCTPNEDGSCSVPLKCCNQEMIKK
jgi:hypothetical protein